MTQRSLAVATVLAAISVGLLVPSASAQVQQQSARRLEPTTTSAEARSTFITALDYANNIFPSRARAKAAEALAADPGFGLARVLAAAASPAMPAAERTAELDRGVADASRGSAGELLFASAVRSNVAGRTAEAHTLAAAAAALLPDDPNIAFMAVQTGAATQLQDGMRDITRRFPEFAPAYNILAYQLNASGDRNGALQTVQMYVRLAPNQPNSHDSFAEMLQFAGRLPEALTHYEAAARIDSGFDQAYVGMGEVHMLMGHGDAARASYTMGIDRAPTPAAKIASQASRASTWILEGKAKDALRELATIAAAAEQQALNPQAAGIYRGMAVVEAAFGDRNAIGAELAKAAALGGAEVPAQYRIVGVTAALSGDVAGAKAAATKYREAYVNGTVAQQNTTHELDAIVAATEKDLATAQSELAKAGNANLGRAVVAEALKKAGRKAEADSLKTAIMTSGTVTVFDLVARAKVAKM